MPDPVTPDEPRVPDPRVDHPFDLPAETYRAVLADWPSCDERTVWTIADHWYAVAAATGEPALAWQRAGRASTEVVAALGGPVGDGSAGDAFAEAWRALADAAGGMSPAVLRQVAEELGLLAEGYARDVQAAKLRVWIELGNLAIDRLGLSIVSMLTLGDPASSTTLDPPSAGHLAAGLAAVRQLLVGLDAGIPARAAVTTLRLAARSATGPPAAAAPTRTPEVASEPSHGLDARRRAEVARHFVRAAERRRELARDAARRADQARRDPLDLPAEPFDRLSSHAGAAHADLAERARLIRHPTDGPDAPQDGGQAAPPGHGGLRMPMGVHQAELDRAVPRNADGQVPRLADPRIGDWFARLNDGGPAADPTRATNAAETVLALYATYLLGRPRVAAPRTFDGYGQGDPDRQPGADPGACARVEAETGGRFQGLCPDVTGVAPRDARQAVEHAFTNLGNHLLNIGPGAFAFVAARTEGGKAHLWAAANQQGTVLHLDAQSRIITDLPVYGHAGRASSGNVVLMDALVVDGNGTYAPLPFHTTGPFSTAPSSVGPFTATPPDAEPGGSGVPAGVPSTLDSARRAVAATVRPTLAETVVRLVDRHAERPSDLTATLLDPARRDTGLRILAALAGHRPGAGPNRREPTGPDHRKPTGVDRPAPDPAAGDLSPVLLAEHIARLRHRVAPAVQAELEDLAGVVRARTGATVVVTVRLRSVEAIVDAVERSPARSRTGDMVDAMDARLLAPDPPTLAELLAAARETFGERIGQVRDTDAASGPHTPVDLVVSGSVDDRPYAFTLRLVTLRAVIAAELGMLDGSPVNGDDVTPRVALATIRETIISDVEAELAEDAR